MPDKIFQIIDQIKFSRVLLWIRHCHWGLFEITFIGLLTNGIRLKKTETSPKWIFLRRFLFFFEKIIGNPSNLFFRGISRFFYPFPRFLGWILVYTGLSFEGFLNIFDAFPHFLGPFPVFRKSLNSQFVDRFPFFGGPFSSFFFWVHFRFSEKCLNSQFVDQFPLFFGPFPIFLGSVSGFQKKF